MKSILKTLLFLLLLFFIFVPFYPNASDKEDISLRFYEGFRGNKEKINRIENSADLKNIFIKEMISKVSIAAEIKKLKRIFNLKDIKVITVGNLIPDHGKIERNIGVKLSIDRELLVKLMKINKKGDEFKVEVFNIREKFPVLLEVEIVMPVGKAAILGFEDPGENIFFLSFFRENYPQNTVGKPRLIKRVEPQYPPAAIKAGIGGKVFLEVSTDLNGNVKKIEFAEGHELLVPAAIAAIKKWKYEPYIVDGNKKPVRFSVICRFNLPQKPMKNKFKIEKKQKEMEKNKSKLYVLETILKNILDFIYQQFALFF